MKSPSSDSSAELLPGFQAQFSISEVEFTAFRQLIYSLVGIQLNEQKKMLVISRLSRRLRQLQLTSFSQYLDYLQTSPDKESELVTLINQMTTNKTDFFREIHHFDFMLQNFLPQVSRMQTKNLRIWSAGCSTGEEPYSIAMVVDDFGRINPGFRHGLDLKILASDVDTNVLAKAQSGRYHEDAIAPIPPRYQSAYFSREGSEFTINPSLQSVISFKRFNLMHDFPFRHGFDLIFCRNVLIYFSQEDRLQIIQKFNANLRPQGYLILGHSESLLAENCGFRSLGNTIYQKI